MSQAEFEIVISPEGKVSLEVKGAQGKVCTDLSKFLEEALGHVEERKFKSEYYQSNQSSGQQSFQNQQY